MKVINVTGFIAFSHLLLAIPSLSAQKGNLPEWQKKYDSREVREKFISPPMFYAPHTFWFWDDVIKDEHQAATMAKEMAKQRLNPGYAHPRSGFDAAVTALPAEQYLAKPWFDSFNNALKASKSKGMTLGYCDEYNWPSGQAAGRVLEKHPELEARHLALKRYYVSGKWDISFDDVDFAVAGKLTDKLLDASSLRIIGEGSSIRWTVPEGDWVVYTYTKKFHPGMDGGRVNYLDPKLMEVFIPMVHEQYDKHFKNEMGKGIPGVFVDNEGDYGWQMAWSDYFAQHYQEKKNRDIRVWLPLLTETDKDGLFVKARCDWFDVVSDVYNACYIEPLVGWLKDRNMYYISNLWEESLLLQTSAVGDFMRTTRCVTMPGTDCLEMKSQDVHDFKETQTVAEFENRPFMSEIMGVAGWIQSPEMMKMTINSITAFGVNHVVPHGIYMNRQLETVPFPTDWYTENPYWNYLHYWNDFVRRAAFVTRQSKLVADVLLVNPVESVWAFSDGYFSDELRRRDEAWDKRAVETEQVYSDAMRSMSQENIDFLIADKHYLSKSTVQPSNGTTKISINDHDFQAIVVPAVYVIARSSFDKIVEFAQKGGLVVLLGELPQGTPENGWNDQAIIARANALKQLPNVVNIAAEKDRMGALVTTLNEKMKPQMRFENAGRLFTAHRKAGSTDLYWLSNNTDSVKLFTAWLRDGNGGAEIWNCETGEMATVPAGQENGYRKVSLTLQPFEGYWLAFNPDGKKLPEFRQSDKNQRESVIDTKWTLSYPEADTVCKTTAKVFFSDEMAIDPAKMQVTYNDSGWDYYSKHQKSDSPSMYWRVNIPVGAKSVILPAYLLGEEIWLDGRKQRVSDLTIQLPSDIRLLSFALHTVGKPVSVAPFRFIVGTKENMELKPWYAYGLQQFTGYLDYETTVRVEKTSSGISIDLGTVKYMAEVFVNGKSVGARMWPPYRFDISDKLKSGENKIRVRIGNLIANQMWMKDDMGKLRTWGWRGAPDMNQCEAGLSGPVKLIYAF